VVGADDDVCVDFWADVCGVIYCGFFAEVEVLKGREEFRRRSFMALVWVGGYFASLTSCSVGLYGG
jgi:hypothetical protein